MTEGAAIRRRAPMMIAAAVAGGQGLVYLSNPLLAKLYGPDLIGQAQVFLSIATIICAVSTLRLEARIPAATDEELSWLLRTSLATNAITAIIAGLAIALLVAPQAGVLIGILVVGLGATPVITQFNTRCQQFGRMAFSKFLQGSSQAATQVGMGLASVSAGMKIGYCLSYLVAITAQSGKQVVTLCLSRSSAPLEIGHKKKILAGAFTLTMAAVLNTAVIWYIPVYMDLAYGGDSVGLAAMAQRLVIMPVGVLTTSLAPIFVSEYARRLRNGENIATLTATWFIRLFAVGIGVIGIAIAAVALGVLDSFGEEWTGLDRYVLAYLLIVFGMVSVGPISQALAVGGHFRTQLIWDAARFASVITTSILYYFYGEDPVGAVMAIAGMQLIFYLLQAGLIVRAARTLDSHRAEEVE